MLLKCYTFVSKSTVVFSGSCLSFVQIKKRTRINGTVQVAGAASRGSSATVSRKGHKLLVLRNAVVLLFWADPLFSG